MPSRRHFPSGPFYIYLAQVTWRGDVLKGDIWKRDFEVKFALDISICSALSKAIPQGKHHLDLLLQSWRPSKEVPKPWPRKVPKKCFGKCRSGTGCRGKCRRKCSGLCLLYYLCIGAERGALSSAPRFGPACTFRSTFRHFSWPGLRHFFRRPPELWV